MPKRSRKAASIVGAFRRRSEQALTHVKLRLLTSVITVFFPRDLNVA